MGLSAKEISIPSYIQSLSDLPRGKTLRVSSGPLHVPESIQKFVAIYELVSHEGKETNQVYLLVASGYENSIHVANYKKLLKNNSSYTLLGVRKLDKPLMGALYSSDILEASSQEGGNGNELIQFFEQIIADALDNHVSDIHIEKRSTKALIRMRKHGELMEYKTALSPKFAVDLCTVIYNVLAENKDIVFVEDDYQSAAVNRVVGGQEVKLRYQSLPVYPGGFDVVLRVLPIGKEDEAFVDLDKLGYSVFQIKTILDVIAKPVGALIIAGTTGSGKSTTLKNLIMYANASRGYKGKIYTIEDPPEYRIPRVSQIPVVRRRGEDYTKKSPFEDPLTATMRGDPDILMIGEIRDKYTGDGLKKATQSGHQVMTTVHASSALAIIERISDFGITASVMGSPDFITGLVYQKLLPILCEHCATSFYELLEGASVDQSILDLSKRLEDVTSEQDVIKIRGAGCKHCNDMGVVGRTVCAEVIAPDFNMLDMFKNKDATGAYLYWRSLSDRDPYSPDMRGKPALEHALFKMRKGLLSPYDIEEAFGPLNASFLSMKELDEKIKRTTNFKVDPNKAVRDLDFDALGDLGDIDLG